ncbi:activating signal cointegrator 1 complex subunit 1 [Eucyclogobius newberryi]|uniref:activating signal cointegrator 1 complex subunit 1 n=1 Tax=Eucyclogobius newberryi TaxID=166745 RepID=UPI003B5A02B7
MEILRPQLVIIDGRQYRRNVIEEDQYEEEEEFYCSGPTEPEDLMEDESCDTHCVEQTERGFRCAIDVPSVLYKYIIGKKGETRRRLEHDTKTNISIPKQGVEGQIVITGAHKSAVSSAVTRVELLVDSFRRKQPFTHFLSFPLNEPQIQDSFLKFKDQVLEKCSQDRGVEASVFQNPSKLHLTVGTLALLNELEVKRVCEQLQQCQDFIREITGGRPLRLEVKGVEYMNDDPGTVDVLYAKVDAKDGSDKLQALADRLVEHFVSLGLMVREWDRVKLHGTVMNTLFRKDSAAKGSGSSGGKPVNTREAFDARNILKTFGSYRFGELDLNTVLLSQRYSSDCTGYYSTAGQIRFS